MIIKAVKLKKDGFSICGYVYDPAEHDGVPFEDLPEDWRCPRCKQPKSKFNPA
jgi:rubredoxin